MTSILSAGYAVLMSTSLKPGTVRRVVLVSILFKLQKLCREFKLNPIANCIQ